MIRNNMAKIPAERLLTTRSLSFQASGLVGPSASMQLKQEEDHAKDKDIENVSSLEFPTPSKFKHLAGHFIQKSVKYSKSLDRPQIQGVPSSLPAVYGHGHWPLGY